MYAFFKTLSKLYLVKAETLPLIFSLIFSLGKTTLINEFLKKTKLKYKLVSGDDLQLGIELSKCTQKSTEDFMDDYELIVIDEAQRIENIGLALKLMVDNYPKRYFIATGSSAFDLASKTSEALTGRKNVIELLKENSKLELKFELENYLLFGSYPEVISANKEKTIKQIANSYLLKDILEF